MLCSVYLTSDRSDKQKSSGFEPQHEAKCKSANECATEYANIHEDSLFFSDDMCEQIAGVRHTLLL